MIKELRYLLFVITIFLFIFFTIKYYFSDQNIKKSNLKINNYNEYLQKFSEKLPVIENDTDNIIEYIDNVSEKKKEYTFWDLLK